jgi:hypothetical protein
MKITTTKVIQELQLMGWVTVNGQLVKDVIKIINKKLKEQKGISIK